MTAERMEYLLEPKGNLVSFDERQQITPQMEFLCSGMITKWIFGAKWNGSKQKYPKFQIWNKTGEHTYELIKEIQAPSFQSKSNTKIYEFDSFPTIPVQPGFLLGLLTPPMSNSRLSLRAEQNNAPTNYYIPVVPRGSLVQKFSMNLNQHSIHVQTSNYHPLVTVEIGQKFLQYNYIL